MYRPHRQFRTFLSRLLLATMLFTQLALAAQPCVVPDAAPTMAFAEDMPCHQQETPPNTCLAHCVGSYQLLDLHQPVADLPALTVAVITLPVLVAEPIQQAQLQPSLLTRVTGPPLSILQQKFLN
jgi:hypothetical protein